MQGTASASLWCALTLLFTQGRATVPCGDSSLTLPSWRSDSEYLTRCVLSGASAASCDWTWGQTASEGESMTYLESKAFRLHEEACLEFWYQTGPTASESSELRVLVKENTTQGVVQIWTSPAHPLRGAWNHVSVPLAHTSVQVVFEAAQWSYLEGHVSFNHVGIRTGQCGTQCEPGSVEWTDQTTRCECSPAQQLSCSSPLCRGGPGGQGGGSPRESPARGACTVHTDPQCSTFDGALFRFLAPCTYTLARTCQADAGLPDFSVEVVNAPGPGNASGPTVQRVNLHVNGVWLSLFKGESQRVMVSGVWQTLPLTLHGDMVHIHSNPAVVTVETNDRVLVSYNNAGAVHVKLPAQYAGKVCGMCGNFNSFREDDNLRPDGSEAPDAADLARSWQTGTPGASCETILVPHICDPLDEEIYGGQGLCGALLSGQGPFWRCLSMLAAESYFRSCVAGMCASHGDRAAMCRTLQSYADICQEAGVAVPAWRNGTYCTQECGANSHYEACAHGCQDTCSSMDLAGACGSCEERCVCNQGFKLSGGVCVLAEECGCWNNGRHYKKGAVFIVEGCTHRCQCLGNGKAMCSVWGCSGSQVCKDKDGVKGCFDPETVNCSIYGDPHYITYDNKAYDFQGGCNYTLATTCGEQTPAHFTVTGRNVNPTDQNLTRSKLDTVVLQMQELHLTLDQSGQVYVHNDVVLLPYSSSGSYGTLKVHRLRQQVVVDTDIGLRMIIDGQNRLFLQVDERYMGELCGMCGTYSGWQSDDFVRPDKSNATGSFDFGNSWRVKEDPSPCIAQPDDPKTCDQEGDEMADRDCRALLGDSFSPCIALLNPTIYFSSCMYDHCATNGDLHTLCDSLGSYAAACLVTGVELPDWKNNTACTDYPNTTPPPTTAPLPSASTPDQSICALNCNFDSHMCGWQQLIQDSFDWTRQSGPTPSSLTGPNEDHTTGRGYYLYIEADGMTHGDSARLLSTQCQYTGPLCLQFWYHMYGSASAMALNLYHINSVNGAVKIWSMANNQGPEWQQALVNINDPGSFQIIIEAIRGSDAQSDLAIDDISILYGYCSNASPKLVDSSGSSSVPHASILSQPSCSLDCSFNSNLCGWSQTLTDAFDWTMKRGSTPTLMTGPSADHTGGPDSHYLYIEANNATYGDTARLLSSECSHTGPQCLRFWYHMYGSADTMGLHLYLLKDGLAKAVWRKSNDQGNMWHEAMVDITPTGPFQIIFEGRRGSNDHSDVAMDDVSLQPGYCADGVTPTTSVLSTTTITTLEPHTTPNLEPVTTEAPFHPSDVPEISTTVHQDNNLPSEQPQTQTTEELPTTSQPQPQTTGDSRPQTTLRPQPPTTALPPSPTSVILQPSTTEGQGLLPSPNPMLPTSNQPEMITTLEPESWTTEQIEPITSDETSQTTERSPTTEEISHPSTMRPTPHSTANTEPSTTEEQYGTVPTESRPQPTTTEVTNPTTSRPLPQTTEGVPYPTTTRPHPPTTNELPDPSTTGPQPHTTANLGPPTTEAVPTASRPQPATTEVAPTGSRPPNNTIANPEPPTTEEQYSTVPTASRPQPQTTEELPDQSTTRPQPPTSEVVPTASRPQPPTTVVVPTESRPQPPTTEVVPTTSGPQPSSTANLEPTTTEEQYSTVPTESRPQPQTTEELPDQSTTRPQPPTSEVVPTASRPQPPTTVVAPTATGPQSPTTEVGPTTSGPQPSTSANLEPPTTEELTQPTATSLQPSGTERPHPPTTDGITYPTTARPQPPATTALPPAPTKPVLPTTDRPQQSTTASRPQPQTTEVVPTESRPQPATTEVAPTGSRPPNNTTANPEPPTTEEQYSTVPTASRPQPQTTEELPDQSTTRPQPPTSEVVPTASRPQPPTTVVVPTESRPQPPTTEVVPTTSGPQPSSTANLEPTTTEEQYSTVPTESRPQPQTTEELPDQSTTRPQPPTSEVVPTASRPQPPTTVVVPTATGPQSPTTEVGPTTSGPQPSTSANLEPPTTEELTQPTATSLQPSGTERPHRPTTDGITYPTTARPQPPATTALPPAPTKPVLPTTDRPQQSTTASRPQPQTTEVVPTESRPQPATTEVAPTGSRPPNNTTANPEPPTTEEQYSTVPTASRPQPQTTEELPDQSTTRPQPPTSEVVPTASRPQPPTTEVVPTESRPHPHTTEVVPTESRPQPPTTEVGPTTSGPQPSTTANLEPPTTEEQYSTIPTESRPQPSTTTALPPASTKPVLPTTERPQQSTSLKPTPSCPENSHYSACMPPCRPTCDNLHGPPRCSQDTPCLQGCACDAGFVRRQRVCVPVQQCGCVDREGRLHNFDDEWYSAHCSQKCECEKEDGKGEIQCDDEDECDNDDVCLQNTEGQYNCISTDFAECSIQGDPEYRTFDGLKHEFRGKHSYVLAQTADQSRTLPGFYIEGRYNGDNDDSNSSEEDERSSEEHRHRHRHRHDDSDEEDEDEEDDSRESSSRYRLRSLKIRVYNHTVEFTRNRRLLVDGRISHPPVSPSGGLTIRQRSTRLSLKTDFGLTVEFDGRSAVEIILPNVYRRRVGGLCGNFDRKMKNDLMRRDGLQAASVQEFGESWRV